MMIAAAELELFIYEAASLKEKRSVIKSLIERTRIKFNAAIAEVGDNDLWQKSVIGIACISNHRQHALQQLDHIIQFFEEDARIEVRTVTREEF